MPFFLSVLQFLNYDVAHSHHIILFGGLLRFVSETNSPITLFSSSRIVPLLFGQYTDPFLLSSKGIISEFFTSFSYSLFSWTPFYLSIYCVARPSRSLINSSHAMLNYSTITLFLTAT